MKSIQLASALALLSTVTSAYDLQTQCDSRWGSDQLGVSGNATMCTTGGAVSSLAILLDDCDQELYGFDVNPGSLNRWLKANNGFTNGNQLVWHRIDFLSKGVNFITTTISANSIK